MVSPLVIEYDCYPEFDSWMVKNCTLGILDIKKTLLEHVVEGVNDRGVVWEYDFSGFLVELVEVIIELVIIVGKHVSTQEQYQLMQCWQEW